jgi:hypothetical protein
VIFSRFKADNYERPLGISTEFKTFKTAYFISKDLTIQIMLGQVATFIPLRNFKEKSNIEWNEHSVQEG